MDEAKKNLEFIARGGTFSDENLEQSLDWPGESVEKAPIIEQEGTSVQPKTSKQQEDEQLAIERVSPAIIAIITKRVEQDLLRGEGGIDSSIFGLFERKMKIHSDKVQLWIDSQDAKLNKLESVDAAQVAELKKDIPRLEEQIRVLESKMDTYMITTAKNGADEIAVLHECQKMLKERRAVDESEVGSLPSIVPRLQDRTDAVMARMQLIEADIAPAVERVEKTTVPAAAARRRFGKRN